MTRRWDEDPAQHTDDSFTMACGGCGFPFLRVTHQQWHTVTVLPCPLCDGGVDVAHARRAISCPTCEDDMGPVPAQQKEKE